MVDLITLILPHHSAATAERLPVLEMLLSRGEPVVCSDGHWSNHHLDPAQSGRGVELPFAPYCCLADGGMPGVDYWLCASPAHLVADQDKVYLAAHGESLAISGDEAAQLATEFNELFHEDGWQLYALSPSRWYLRLPQPMQLRTTPPQQALSFDIRPLLPQGEQAMALHAALAEIEMLFHGSIVNSRRRERGLPLVNGLWLWGGGLLPQQTRLRWHSLQGGAPWLKGLALHAGQSWSEVAGTADSILKLAGEHLVVFDDAQHTLAALEMKWFAPLLQALQQGRLQRLELHLTSARMLYRIERRHLRRWWRRRQPWIRYTSTAK